MTYDDAFTSLLFGEGNLIGIMLLVAINIILLTIRHYGKALVIPINLLFAWEYFDHGQNFAWHGIIMIFLCCFNLLSIYFTRKK